MRLTAGPAILAPSALRGRRSRTGVDAPWATTPPPLPWEPDVVDGAVEVVGVSCVGRGVPEAPAHDVSQHRARGRWRRLAGSSTFARVVASRRARMRMRRRAPPGLSADEGVTPFPGIPGRGPESPPPPDSNRTGARRRPAGRR
jgi:hypothetical protein